MALSVAEKGFLSAEYDNLAGLLAPQKHDLWLAHKEEIITFCAENNIKLYDIGSLQLQKAARLLTGLINHFSKPHTALPNSDMAQWENKCQGWKRAFEAELNAHKGDAADMHNKAHLSVADQYKKTKKVSKETLLTMKDMHDLLGTQPVGADKIVVEPFSLIETTETVVNRIEDLLTLEENKNKDIVLPTTHDGHWFYLLRKNGNWTLQDSQPKKDGALTPRQELLLDESTKFLTKVAGQPVVVSFETSGQQLNNFDCGTRVVNGVKKAIDPTYQVKEHTEILQELLQKQLSPQEFQQLPPDVLPAVEKPNPREFREKPKAAPLTDKEKAVIETTVSSQPIKEKAQQYKENLQDLMHAVKSNSLFEKVKKPIDIENLDKAEHEEGESDEDFATRLQEAEFRKAGLK